MFDIDISYKDYKKKHDIHGSVLYPATMVAPMQKEILSRIINKKQNMRILDPFHGSGISLYEAAEISDNIEVFGFDINPLANLITRAKFLGVTSNIEKDIVSLKTYMYSNDNFVPHKFHNIEKWFKPEMIESLSKIRNAIIKIKSKRNRMFFWSVFSEIVRKNSNTRSSTYKLHVRASEQIQALSNDSKKKFIQQIEENHHYYKKKSVKSVLVKCDSLLEMKKYEDGYFDIVVTSPPYGDNATTVPYGQFSMLPLYWIDKKDLEMDGWELDNYSIIDSSSMGGKYSDITSLDITQNTLLYPYVSQMSKDKAVKVEKFMSDYFQFLDEASRITKDHIVLTLGNRTVDGVNINLTEITMNFLITKGFDNKAYLEREIVNKRIPPVTSNKRVASMNKEYLLVMKRATT